VILLNIGYLLKKSWNDFKKHYLKYMIFNIIWFFVITFLYFITLRSIFGGNYFILAIPILAGGPLILVGLELAYNSNFEIKKVLKRVRKKLYTSLIIFVFSAVVYGVLVYDFFFVLDKVGNNKLFLIFPVIILYLIIMFNMYQINLWGMISEDYNLRFFKYLKKAYQNTVYNFLFALLWSLIIFVFIIILLLTRVGAFLFLNSFVSILILNGKDHMLEKESEEEMSSD